MNQFHDAFAFLKRENYRNRWRNRAKVALWLIVLAAIPIIFFLLGRASK